MSMEGPRTPETLNPKEAFMGVITKRIEELKMRSQLPDAYFDGLHERATLIEGPFVNAKDAKEKAEQFLTFGVEPLAEYADYLALSEERLSGDLEKIQTASDSVNALNVSDEIKQELLAPLERARDSIEELLLKIRETRASIS